MFLVTIWWHWACYLCFLWLYHDIELVTYVSCDYIMTLSLLLMFLVTSLLLWHWACYLCFLWLYHDIELVTYVSCDYIMTLSLFTYVSCDYIMTLSLLLMFLVTISWHWACYLCFLWLYHDIKLLLMFLVTISWH